MFCCSNYLLFVRCYNYYKEDCCKKNLLLITLTLILLLPSGCSKSSNEPTSNSNITITDSQDEMEEESEEELIDEVDLEMIVNFKDVELEKIIRDTI